MPISEEASTYPDVGKCRVKRCEAIAPGCFCEHCYTSHEDAHEAVLEYAEVDDLVGVRSGQVECGHSVSYIEPCQSAARSPPKVPATFCEPIERPNPRLRFDASEVVFLTVKIWRYVMTQKRKEAGNGKSFITIPDDFKVYGMPVKGVRQERDCGIDGNHEEYPDGAMIDSAQKSGVNAHEMKTDIRPKSADRMRPK
ncbi:MAG: hypothetical protein Q9169_003772 [Polycauliona sp. 2 TL-2023]